MINNIMEIEIKKLFDDKVLNELDPNLTLLPNELKRDIFEKYFYPNRLVLDLLDELQSHECKLLDTKNLVPILGNVLKDNLAVKYLYENYIFKLPSSSYKQNIFKKLYDDIIVNKIKYFVLITDPVEDFALMWVFTMYK
jgi:hypothetical protein